MGNWHISIKGTGIHHNSRPDDADQMASKFVEELRKAGHSISSADITSGYTHPLPYPQDVTVPTPTQQVGSNP